MENPQNENILLRQPTKEKKIQNFAFKQQLLNAWKPKPTMVCAIIIYLIIGISFVLLGSFIYYMSEQVANFELQYNKMCPVPSISCKKSFTLEQDFEGPVFIYYRITDFYQNHRRYIQAMDRAQLRGDDSDTLQKTCVGALFNREFPFLLNKPSIEGNVLNPDDYAIPCGMAARAYFNDTFVIKDSQNQTIDISDKDIAWIDDKKYRFKNSNKKKQWIDIENERFMNWMKISPFSNVRKTWGKINQDLKKGDYTIEINSQWDSDIFGGKKYFGLTNTNSLGGENHFLGMTYIIVGSISIIIAIVFIVRKLQRPKGVLNKKIEEATLKVDNLQESES